LSKFLTLSHLRTLEASTYQFDRYIFIGVEIFTCEGKKNLLVPHSTLAARETMQKSITEGRELPFLNSLLKFMPLTKC